MNGDNDQTGRPRCQPIGDSRTTDSRGSRGDGAIALKWMCQYRADYVLDKGQSSERANRESPAGEDGIMRDAAAQVVVPEPQLGQPGEVSRLGGYFAA